VYSGRWTPVVDGVYTLTFPGGDVVAVRVIAPGTPGLFRAPVSIPIGSWPQAVAIDDVNGDGRNDVVIVTSYNFDPDNDFLQRWNSVIRKELSVAVGETPIGVIRARGGRARHG